MSAVEGTDTTAAAIRARLEELTVESATTTLGSVYVMRDALRAVLDLCAGPDGRSGYYTGPEFAGMVRRAIATALGGTP